MTRCDCRMNIFRYFFRALSAFVFFQAFRVCAATNSIDPQRVKEIAAMISPEPASFGEPITNRAVWAKVAADPALHNIIRQAEKLAAEPFPEITDDLYLDFTRTGNRDRGQKVLFAQASRVCILTL